MISVIHCSHFYTVTTQLLVRKSNARMDYWKDILYLTGLTCTWLTNSIHTNHLDIKMSILHSRERQWNPATPLSFINLQCC